jgi:hypothetical protein
MMAAYAYGREPCPWYGKMRWRRMAKAQLREHPLCVMCLQRGQVIPATVADHVEPHRGDEHAFWFGKLQSLCVPCHNHHKRFEEMRGYTTDIDASGWPTDPRHPANRS